MRGLHGPRHYSEGHAPVRPEETRRRFAAGATYAPLPTPPAPRPDGLRSLEAHRDYLLSCVTELPPFGQQLLDALGLSICEDVVSPINLPRFDNSAMDGYAVRAADVAGATADRPVSLPVVGEIAAGQSAPHRLSPHTAMKIMTGAPGAGRGGRDRGVRGDRPRGQRRTRLRRQRGRTSTSATSARTSGPATS